MRIHPAIPVAVAALIGGIVGGTSLPVRAETPHADIELVAEPVRGSGPAVVIVDGRIAVTIPVDEVIGLASLVLPGDRVDVFVTQKRMGLNASEIAMTDRILHDVRVLAVAADDGASGFRNVTIEVTSEGREMIDLAMRLGTLSLMLRSAGATVASISSTEAAPADPAWTAGNAPATGLPVVQPLGAVLSVGMR